MSEEDLDDMDTQRFSADGHTHMTQAEAGLLNDDWNVTTRAEDVKIIQKTQAKNMMTVAGWMDNLADKSQTAIPKQLRVDQDMSSKDWKKVLADKKSDLLKARDDEAEKKKANTLPKNTEVNEVKVVDRQYFLSKDFRAGNEEVQKLLDDTVTQFSLNEAQERAFRIVANHSVEIVW